MTIEPDLFLQLGIGCLLGVIGWGIRQIMARLDSLEKAQSFNTGRLIRIETKLGIVENNGHDVA